jgi:hypothetical protein
MKLGSVIKNVSSLYLLVKRNQWRHLRASGFGPGFMSDDDFEGESTLVLEADLASLESIEDLKALYRKAKEVLSSSPEHVTQEYRYGAQNRPPDYATIPTGAIRIDDPIRGIPQTRHGVVVYNRPLTEEEAYSYELARYYPLNEVIDAGIQEGMGRYQKEYADAVRKDGPTALRDIGDRIKLGGRAGFFTDIPLGELAPHVAEKLVQLYPGTKVEEAKAPDIVLNPGYGWTIEQQGREVYASNTSYQRMELCPKFDSRGKYTDKYVLRFFEPGDRSGRIVFDGTLAPCIWEMEGRMGTRDWLPLAPVDWKRNGPPSDIATEYTYEPVSGMRVYSILPSAKTRGRYMPMIANGSNAPGGTGISWYLDANGKVTDKVRNAIDFQIAYDAIEFFQKHWPVTIPANKKVASAPATVWKDEGHLRHDSKIDTSTILADYLGIGEAVYDAIRADAADGKIKAGRYTSDIRGHTVLETNEQGQWVSDEKPSFALYFPTPVYADNGNNYITQEVAQWKGQYAEPIVRAQLINRMLRTETDKGNVQYFDPARFVAAYLSVKKYAPVKYIALPAKNMILLCGEGHALALVGNLDTKSAERDIQAEEEKKVRKAQKEEEESKIVPFTAAAGTEVEEEKLGRMLRVLAIWTIGDDAKKRSYGMCASMFSEGHQFHMATTDGNSAARFILPGNGYAVFTDDKWPRLFVPDLKALAARCGKSKNRVGIYVGITESRKFLVSIQARNSEFQRPIAFDFPIKDVIVRGTHFDSLMNEEQELTVKGFSATIEVAKLKTAIKEKGKVTCHMGDCCLQVYPQYGNEGEIIGSCRIATKDRGLSPYITKNLLQTAIILDATHIKINQVGKIDDRGNETQKMFVEFSGYGARLPLTLLIMPEARE